MLKKNVLGRVSVKLDFRDQLMKANKDLKVDIERTKMQKELVCASLTLTIDFFYIKLPIFSQTKGSKNTSLSRRY